MKTLRETNAPKTTINPPKKNYSVHIEFQTSRPLDFEFEAYNNEHAKALANLSYQENPEQTCVIVKDPAGRVILSKGLYDTFVGPTKTLTEA